MAVPPPQPLPQVPGSGAEACGSLRPETAPESDSARKRAWRLRLRRAIADHRATLGEAGCAQAAQAIAIRLTDWLREHMAHSRNNSRHDGKSPPLIAGWIPIGNEIDVLPALHAVHQLGASLALPFVTGRTTPMKFLRWSPGAPLYSGPFGLSQPSPDASECAPDVILTPMLGFDASMNRLGQGAAHYDRAFATHPEAMRIGVAWSVQQAGLYSCAPWPVESWDLPLHMVLTETGWVRS